jgi:hypothetical protein
VVDSIRFWGNLKMAAASNQSLNTILHDVCYQRITFCTFTFFIRRRRSAFNQWCQQAKTLGLERN